MKYLPQTSIIKVSSKSPSTGHHAIHASSQGRVSAICTALMLLKFNMDIKIALLKLNSQPQRRVQFERCCDVMFAANFSG